MKNLIMTFCLMLVCWYELDYSIDSKGQVQIEQNIYCDRYLGEIFLMEEKKSCTK